MRHRGVAALAVLAALVSVVGVVPARGVDTTLIKVTKVASTPSAIPNGNPGGQPIGGPTAMAFDPSTGLAYVGTRAGYVFGVTLAPNGGGIGTLVLDAHDLTDAYAPEGGLTGLTFSPDGSKLYVHLADRGPVPNSGVCPYPAGGDRVIEYALTGTPKVANTTTRRDIIMIPNGPNCYHYGGEIQFGPDGKFYIAHGVDFGWFSYGQNRNNLYGKILRIAITASGQPAYTIPADNPDPRGANCNGRAAPTGGANCGEIWMLGLRNPFRFSFDGGDFYVGDVGENNWEEVDHAAAGTNNINWGWPGYNGPDRNNGYPDNPNTPAWFEYQHGTGAPGLPFGCAVIGGRVYHGARIPGLAGRYIFVDFCGGSIWSAGGGDTVMNYYGAPVLLNGQPTGTSVGAGVPYPVQIVNGPDGELYVVSIKGAIYRIDPAT